MTSKVHLALFLLFACTVTVSAVEDNFQGENDEKFSQQNGPSYCWFARDVTAAMLVFKNKSTSLLWELNSIFM